jgi:hypothetical protein
MKGYTMLDLNVLTQNVVNAINETPGIRYAFDAKTINSRIANGTLGVVTDDNETLLVRVVIKSSKDEGES